MNKLIVMLFLLGSLYANKCFVLVGHYNSFSDNEKKTFIAGLQDRFDYEIRENNYRYDRAQLEYLQSFTVDDLKKRTEYFIKKNKEFQGYPIENFCVSDIFGLVMDVTINNKFNK